MNAETMLPTCYRHPDRETRLACTVCDRPVCVECMRTAPVGQRCPECDGGAPRSVVAPAARRPLVTYTFIGACVAVFLLMSGGITLREEAFLRWSQVNVLVAQGETWRLLTSAFLHADVMHIAFNMWALWLFGPEFERQVGRVPFATMYVASALGGGAMYFLVQPASFVPAVGASGAVFGLFGAWLVASYRNRHTPGGNAMLRQLLVLLAINAGLGFMPGLNIAWQAHLGGLLAGGFIAAVWSAPPLRGRPTGRVLVAVAVGVLAVLLTL